MFLYYQDKISIGKLLNAKKLFYQERKTNSPPPLELRGERAQMVSLFVAIRRSQRKKVNSLNRFLAELKAFAVLMLTEPLSFGFGQLSSLRLSALRFADGSLRMRAPTGCSRLQ